MGRKCLRKNCLSIPEKIKLHSILAVPMESLHWQPLLFFRTLSLLIFLRKCLSLQKILKDKEGLKDAGFKVLFAKEYFFNEYYQTEQEFDLFLQGVPIFEDYDSRKDKVKLLSYVKNNRTSKGIRLERHRVITVSQRKND